MSRIAALLLLLCSVACGQEFKVSPRYNISERVQPVANADSPAFHVALYTAKWCTNCPGFKKSKDYAEITAAYGVTELDYDTCDAAFKKDIKYLPAIRLVDSKTLKTIDQWFWPKELKLSSIKEAESNYLNPKVETVVVKPIKYRMSFDELIREHNRIHGGNPNRRWTWPGGTEESLREHLRTVHGVNTG